MLIICFISCGPIPEETAHQKALKDSAEADSLMNTEANKIKIYERAKKNHEDSLKRVLEQNSLGKKDSLKDSTQNTFNSKISINPSKKDSLNPVKKTKSDSLSRIKRHRTDSLLKRKKLLSDTLRKPKKLHPETSN